MAITKINAAYQEKETLAVAGATISMSLDVARGVIMMDDDDGEYDGGEEEVESLAVSVLFQREEFIGGVMLMLRALPQNLTDGEVESLCQVLPTSVVSSRRRKRSVYYDHHDGTYSKKNSQVQKRRSPPPAPHKRPDQREENGDHFSQDRRQQSRRRHLQQHSSRRDYQDWESMPSLRRAIALAVTMSFWIVAWLVTNLYVLAKLAARFERRHRVGTMAIEKSSDLGMRVVGAAVDGLKDGVSSGLVAVQDILLSDCAT